MAKKSKKDLLIDLLILLFVAACVLLILRLLVHHVRMEILIRNIIGMRPATLGTAPKETRFLTEETTCNPPKSCLGASS